MIRLLLHNALRVDEALGADIADLGTDRGHQVLTVLGKGNRRAKVALTPATLTALHAYLSDRASQRRARRVARDGRAAAGHHHRRADAAQSAVGTRPPARRGRRDRASGIGSRRTRCATPASPWR